nr:MAG TPA: hypothetical protein [Caudoviricetes sp.]
MFFDTYLCFCHALSFSFLFCLAGTYFFIIDFFFVLLYNIYLKGVSYIGLF